MTCEIGSTVSFARVLPLWETGVGCRWACKVAESPQSERDGKDGDAPSLAARWLSHPWLGWRCGAGGGRPSPLSSTGGTAHIMLAHAHTQTQGCDINGGRVWRGGVPSWRADCAVDTTITVIDVRSLSARTAPAASGERRDLGQEQRTAGDRGHRRAGVCGDGGMVK